ncbi:MAG: Ni/Fe-hydrogenase cytochrome b subunit [Proteobacteria bacterium]|nr:Ni/Fe-hydrogenase cytochrome b subunit [Pseudomonadota bacterium]MBU1389773.1 Ni/Fe-hydrogenase cytochrome b subunit [Pseudomonadota bacterium]MBU1543782.1 Ni/Fe-hydrogenase cytochrome b subunit [Pseudomonadota bacterium]MBU2431725.1 Ni/Fe-hydrogenase cytochrome b subunit [Pseudomonadota bacterium]MBU2479591.1 Ni/Fe-hydrogenase cytochrome b subunit [Pseudomonadota bacterium]
MEHKARPLNKKFWTPGVMVMLVFMAAGAVSIIARFTGGIGYVTNLSDARPWGLWVGVDVATGVALAAGGFTTAALAHIFGRHNYESITRPALLTAVLGYTFVVLGLLVDIGRSWAIWKPMFNWNTNSVLFEVAMCVMVYLTVLYIEFFPIVAEQFKDRVNLPGILSVFNNLVDSILKRGDAFVGKIMWIFIILGVVLSCMHQSSLGSLMLVAPTKLHPLWYTPMLPLLFLTSAFAVGYPMVVFETTLATSSFKLDGEMNILTPLTRITVFLLGMYMFLKIGDMIYRGTYIYLLQGTYQTNSFIVEVLFGVMVPWVLLLFKRIRQSRTGIFIAASMIIGGVILNRINVFIVGYKSPLSESGYFPAPGEIFVTLGLIATLMFIYRCVVTCLPVLQAPEEVSS